MCPSMMSCSNKTKNSYFGGSHTALYIYGNANGKSRTNLGMIYKICSLKQSKSVTKIYYVQSSITYNIYIAKFGNVSITRPKTATGRQ